LKYWGYVLGTNLKYSDYVLGINLKYCGYVLGTNLKQLHYPVTTNEGVECPQYFETILACQKVLMEAR
jgi:hypothetical protein